MIGLALLQAGLYVLTLTSLLAIRWPEPEQAA